MKKAAAILLLTSFSFLSKAQNVGIGADAMYNFQTESLGAGFRVNIHPNNKLSFVPQVSYYFPFNKVHEYYFGLGLEYKFYKVKNFNFYAIGHGAYDSWLNYQESPMKGAKQNNWDFEGGAGVTTNKCLRPFLECRYNVRFRETHVRLGLLYVLGCSGGGTSKRFRGSKKLCPAYG